MRILAASSTPCSERLATFGRVLWVTASAYGLALTYFSNQFAALACVTLIPFFIVIRSSRVPAAAAYGSLWAVVFFSLYGMLKAGEPSLALFGFIVLGVCCFVPFAVAAHLITSRFGFNGVALAVCWLVFELTRIELLLRLGTLADSAPVSAASLNIVAATGMSGLSVLIVLVNVLLIRFWNWAIRTLRGRRRHALPVWREKLLWIETAPARVRCYFIPQERGPPARLRGDVRLVTS